MFLRLPVVVARHQQRMKADLIDYHPLFQFNNGYQYLLAMINCFSCQAWTGPLKNMFGQETVGALKPLSNSAVLHSKVYKRALERNSIIKRSKAFCNQETSKDF